MKRDAYFKDKDITFWYGKTRRGQPVKIRRSEAVDKAIEDSKGWGITVSAPDELFDRAKPSDVIEVILRNPID